MERKLIKSREDMEEVMFSVLEPLKNFYTKEKAGLKVGNTSAHYSDKTALMEGFARPLWALGAYWAGEYSEKSCKDTEEAEKISVKNGCCQDKGEKFADIYRQGLVNGTNPLSEEYWGKCNDYDQLLVEMASIGYTLLFAEEKIWTPLLAQEKENLAAWLNQINDKKCYGCNWRFFQIIVNIALKKVGMPYSREVLEDSLQYIESCYIGGGWYRDGVDGQTDYYIPFAMEFYGLIYAIFMEDEDYERCEEFKRRAEMFGKDFVYWFSENGSALPYGRSLTYRFAQAAFYSACVVAGVEPLPLSAMKGIIVRHLDYWINKPIFDNGGLLTIGYCYPNLQMSESYNAPGSPYWAMKLFMCMALNKDHDFWKCEAGKLPDLEEEKFLEKTGMIMQHRKNGNVVALTSGYNFHHVHSHTEEKYQKFAYSTRYGFSIMRSPVNIQEAAADSVLSFEVFNHIYIRGEAETYINTAEKIITDWSPLAGIKVHTEIVPIKEGHRRLHIIESEYECTAYDSGFAVPICEPCGCQVRILQGEGENITVRPDPNTNLINSKTVIPSAKYCVHKGRNIIETEIIYD